MRSIFKTFIPNWKWVTVKFWKRNLFRFCGLRSIQKNVNNAPSPHLHHHQTYKSEKDANFRAVKTLLLLRAIFVLKLCSNDTLVKNAMKLFDIGNSLLGQKNFGSIMRGTFYGQFCFGESPKEISEAIQRLQGFNLEPLLCITAEEESLGRGDESNEEAWIIEKKLNMLQCLATTSDAMKGRSSPKLMQLKLTALVKSALCEKISKKLREGHERELSSLLDSFLDDGHHENTLLTPQESIHLQTALHHLYDVFKLAQEKKVYIMIDAEGTDINPAIILVVKCMMRRFNKNEPIVQATYQAYLKESYDEVIRDLDFCEKYNLQFGAKIVRGAYLNSERQKAAAEGREDPVWEDWSSTNHNYNKIVAKVIRRISSQASPGINVVVATHNEESINLAIREIHQHNIDPKLGKIMFAQLYGLSDRMSVWLGEKEYLTYKSAPIGSVEDTIPYLSRRAYENNSLTQGNKKDIRMMQKELFRRSFFRS